MNLIFNMISKFSFDVEGYEINKVRYALESKDIHLIAQIGVREGFFNDTL